MGGGGAPVKILRLELEELITGWGGGGGVLIFGILRYIADIFFFLPNLCGMSAAVTTATLVIAVSFLLKKGK